MLPAVPVRLAVPRLALPRSGREGPPGRLGRTGVRRAVKRQGSRFERLTFPASMRGCLTVLALLAGLLILGGLSGWVASGSAASAYQSSPHERLPATVVTA